MLEEAFHFWIISARSPSHSLGSYGNTKCISYVNTANHSFHQKADFVFSELKPVHTVNKSSQLEMHALSVSGELVPTDHDNTATFLSCIII